MDEKEVIKSQAGSGQVPIAFVRVQDKLTNNSYSK
jgi:hypothetical protein